MVICISNSLRGCLLQNWAENILYFISNMACSVVANISEGGELIRQNEYVNDITV